MDYIELATLIRSMNRHSKIYQCLKVELSKLGYWRLKERGNPSKGYQAQQITLARG